MKGKIIIITVTSIFIYFLLVAILYLSSPFLVSWGSNPKWYFKLILFLQNTPFSLLRSNGDYFIGVIFINSFFWIIIFDILLWFFAIKLPSKVVSK